MSDWTSRTCVAVFLRALSWLHSRQYQLVEKHRERHRQHKENHSNNRNNSFAQARIVALARAVDRRAHGRRCHSVEIVAPQVSATDPIDAGVSDWGLKVRLWARYRAPARKRKKCVRTCHARPQAGDLLHANSSAMLLIRIKII